MKKKVIFLEVQGGSDKWLNGHRKDTLPMVHALRGKGWEAEVLYYSNEKKHELFEYLQL